MRRGGLRQGQRASGFGCSPFLLLAGRIDYLGSGLLSRGVVLQGDARLGRGVGRFLWSGRPGFAKPR